MTVGEFIKSVAKSKGTSAAKIERELGFSNGYIGTVRNSSFPYDRLLKIAEHLDVSPEYLWSCGESASNTFSGPLLSDDESALLIAYRKLDNPDRQKLSGYIEGLYSADKYKKAELSDRIG